MVWINVRYPCKGKRVNGGTCHSKMPYPEMFCWSHRDQNPNSPYYRAPSTGAGHTGG